MSPSSLKIRIGGSIPCEKWIERVILLKKHKAGCDGLRMTLGSCAWNVGSILCVGWINFITSVTSCTESDGLSLALGSCTCFVGSILCMGWIRLRYCFLTCGAGSDGLGMVLGSFTRVKAADGGGSQSHSAASKCPKSTA